MLLTWCWKQDGCAGRAAPMPDGCDAHVCTERDPDQNGHDIWRWSAGWPNGQASQSDYATERQAQLACEAALIRLGVVQLPEWHQSDKHGMQEQLRWYHTKKVNGLHATATDFDGRWVVWNETNEPIVSGGGPGPGTPRYALNMAEIHLRAELAARCDALAAKEGAP